MDHLWIPIVCNCMKFCIKSFHWRLNYTMKTKYSMVAAAVLNFFLIASLNMPSLGHSLPSKYQILCNISILNRVIETWCDSRWHTYVGLSKTWLLTHCRRHRFSITICKNFDQRPNYGSKTKFNIVTTFILNLFLIATFIHASCFH